MKQILTFRGILLSAVIGLATACTAEPPADLILTGGMIRTFDPERPDAEAIAIRDGRIIAVGDSSACLIFRGEATRVIPLNGALVIPGLTDAHAHLMNLGRLLSQVNLIGTESVAAAAGVVRARVAHTPAGIWVKGRGWDQNDWESKEYPTYRDLSGTEHNPVYLRRVDGHAAWVNRVALDLCGITRDTPDPPGGRIIRDATGEPTGVFIDNAEDLITAHIPAEGFEERVEFARRAMAECAKNGLTGIHDAGVDSLTIEVLRELGTRGELTLRVYGMLSTDNVDYPVRRMQQGPIDEAGGRLRVRAIKVYADGALGSRGAALLAPYDDDPDNSGHFVSTIEHTATLCSLAVTHGFQVCTHAIGDAAVRRTLDLYATMVGNQPHLDHRFRIEHAQVVSPEDIPRFAQLEVIPSMQPTHATSDMPWAEDRLGSERVKGAYAWRQLANAGCRIANGSDFPVESVNPLWGIYAAVTRQDHNGLPSGGWQPQERMTIEEVVLGFTRYAAYAAFADSALGMVRAGFDADLTVLDRDIFTLPAAEILQTRSLYTIVGGQIVYEAE